MQMHRMLTTSHYSIPLYKHDSLSRVSGDARVAALEQRHGVEEVTSIVQLTSFNVCLCVCVCVCY